MKDKVLLAIFLSAAMVISAGALNGCSTTKANPPPNSDLDADVEFNRFSEFVWGTVHGQLDYIELAKDVNIKYVRLNLPWRTLQPAIDYQFTREQVDENPDLIYEFIQNADWSLIDDQIKIWQEASVDVILFIGPGGLGRAEYRPLGWAVRFEGSSLHGSCAGSGY